MLLIAHQKGTKPKSIKKQKPLHVEEFRGDPEGLWRTVSREATGSNAHSSKIAWVASVWTTVGLRKKQGLNSGGLCSPLGLKA